LEACRNSSIIKGQIFIVQAGVSGTYGLVREPFLIFVGMALS
jgi:hypothetical protein